MKRFAFISVLILAALAQAQDSSDRKSDELIGPVCDVHWYKAQFVEESGKWVEGSQKYVRSDHYNLQGTRGLKPERYPYYFHCYNRVEIKTTYDDKGYRTDTLFFTWHHDGQPNGKIVYIYDDKDRTLEYARYDNDDRIVSRMVFKYNEKGHIAEVEYDDKEAFMRKMTFAYEYDSRGNWIKQTGTKWIEESGQLYSQPSMAYYRKISYY